MIYLKVLLIEKIDFLGAHIPIYLCYVSLFFFSWIRRGGSGRVVYGHRKGAARLCRCPAVAGLLSTAVRRPTVVVGPVGARRRCCGRRHRGVRGPCWGRRPHRGLRQEKDVAVKASFQKGSPRPPRAVCGGGSRGGKSVAAESQLGFGVGDCDPPSNPNFDAFSILTDLPDLILTWCEPYFDGNFVDPILTGRIPLKSKQWGGYRTQFVWPDLGGLILGCPIIIFYLGPHAVLKKGK